MSVSVVLYGTTRYVPQSKERNWGAEMTQYLDDIGNGVNGISTLEAGVARVRFSVTDSSLAAGAILTPTHNVHRVVGNGGAVTLNAAGLAAGTTAEQVLILRGTSNVNTVTLPATVATMNGPITLGDGDQISFEWDATDAEWVEQTRSS